MEPGITFRKMPPLHYEPRENKNANRWINTKPSSNRINKNRSRSLFQPPLPDKRSTSVFLYRVRFLQSSLHASMRKEIGSWFERDMENSFSIKVEGLVANFDVWPNIYPPFFIRVSVFIVAAASIRRDLTFFFVLPVGWSLQRRWHGIIVSLLFKRYRREIFGSCGSWFEVFDKNLQISFVQEVCWFLYL